MHYILTLSQPVRGLPAPVTATYAGVAEFAPGTTRSRAYSELFAKYAGALQRETGASGALSGPTVLFFSLEPDQMET
jgi:hypothetical protein